MSELAVLYLRSIILINRNRNEIERAFECHASLRHDIGRYRQHSAE